MKKILLILVYIFEIALLPIFFFYKFYFMLFLIHISSIIIFIIYQKYSFVKESYIKPFNLFLFLLLIFFPFFGMLARLFLSLRKINQRTIERVDIFDEKTLESKTELNFLKKYENFSMLEKIKEDLNFDLFFNILKTGNRQTKLELLAKLANMKANKSSISIIKDLLNSEYHDIKLYASGALMKIEESVLKNIEYAKKKYEQDSNVKHLKDLIKLYEFYLETGLINEKDIYRKHLLEITNLYNIINNKHRDLDFYSGLIKNYILLEDYIKAKEIFNFGISKLSKKYEDEKLSDFKEFEKEIDFYNNFT